jgi:DNA adenine methylase
VMSRSIILKLSSGRLIISNGSGIVRHEPIIQPSVRPVVKWPGGKQWLAVAAPHLAPAEWKGRYFEPFVGGGAFFFALEPGRATLSDCNEELILTYRAIRDDPEGVIRLLSRYPYNKSFYYRMRGLSPRSDCGIAARFLYLNRTCWNGLYRVNEKGEFNTPFGRFVRPTICDEERIRLAAKLLRRARLRVGDFDQVIADAARGDFVYFDPPYTTGHQHNGFLKYNAALFSWPDQKRLARAATCLAGAGVHVLVSNANHPAVIRLYTGFCRYKVIRKSLISGNLASRGVITEVLLSSYPLFDDTPEAF